MLKAMAKWWRLSCAVDCMSSTHPEASAVTADQPCHVCRAISSSHFPSVAPLTLTVLLVLARVCSTRPQVQQVMKSL